MPFIKCLTQDTINKIAAGEVVERPASVVKELTENSVDAGSSSIVVTIEQGGIKLIQVTDDGRGMSEEDARLAIEPHTTSKLTSIDDLNTLHTLGFRGEALASISSVSQFELITKTPESLSGISLTHESARTSIMQCPSQNGTTIKVRNLFFNVPARQKFIKTVSTEFNHILSYIIQFSLVHPELNITLIHNGKKIIGVQKSPWEKRVHHIMGDEYFSQLIPINFESENISINGFIGKPSYHHDTHKKQFLFVNNRPVQEALLARKILEAYETLIPKGKHPAFVLSLTIKPELVDVNIHPRKTEVKFQNQNEVYLLTQSEMKKVLRTENIASESSLNFSQKSDFNNVAKLQRSTIVTPIQFLKIGNQSPSISHPRSSAFSQSKNFSSPRQSPLQSQKAFEFNQQFSSGINQIKQDPLCEKGWKIVGQLSRAFILIDSEEGLKILDQHAVSEIINYHQISQKRENTSVDSQSLLTPQIIQLNAGEKSVIENHQDIFKSLGWSIDQFSENEYMITAIPTSILEKNITEILRSIIDSILDESKLTHLTFEKKAILSQACRSAVMFGDELSQLEMESLINRWLETDAKEACEHGRPSIINIAIGELKKMFKR